MSSDSFINHFLWWFIAIGSAPESQRFLLKDFIVHYNVSFQKFKFQASVYTRAIVGTHISKICRK